jgi:uncharacterized protein
MQPGEHHILDEHDIFELDELLSALQNDDSLRLDAAQGLLAALAVGPQSVSAQQWMPVILGEKPTVDDPQSAERLVELLVRRKRAVDYGIEHYAFDAIFSEVPDENGELHVDAGGWCEGFSLGIDLLADVWEAQMEADDSLIGLLSPIVALGVDDGVFTEIKDPTVTNLSEGERESLMHQLPSVLAEVRHYWDEINAEQAQKNLGGQRKLH